MDDDDIFAGLMGAFRPSKSREALDASILATVQPSDYLPAKGDYFRVRFALIGDRSYMGNIYRCLSFQNGACVGETVHGYSYDKKPKVFLVGDMLFYEAGELWASMQPEASRA